MAIRSNGYYNDPKLGAAFESLASLFGPPTAGDAAHYAAAGLARAKMDAERAEAARLEELDRLARDPNANQSTFDRLGQVAGRWNPSNGYYGVNVGAATSRSNNAADNARALQQTRMQQEGETNRAMLAPVAAGATRFVPPSLSDLYHVPGTQVGTVEAKPGDAVYAPDGRTFMGTAKAPSEAEVKGAILAGMDPSMQKALVMSGAPVENVDTPDGPRIAYRSDAVGGRPAAPAKPISETEWRASEAQRLKAAGKISDDDVVAAIMGSVPVEAVQTPGGPQFVQRSQAVGKTPAPPATAGESAFSRATTLRKEITSSIPLRQYQQALPNYQGMVDAAGRDTKAADLNLVYGFAKMLDPDSVVREGEAVMVKNTASLPDWLQGYISQVNGGAALKPDTRKALMSEAYGRVKAYEDAARRAADRFGPIIDRAQLNRADVLPQFIDVQPWQPPGVAPAAGPAQSTPPVKVASPEEARRLPSGTRIILPDGREGKVP